MTALFLKTQELIKTVSAIKYSDFDIGQLDVPPEIRPNLIFPCTMVNIEYLKTENMTDKIQKVEAIITLRTAFDFLGRTGSNAPVPVVEQSLQYFDTVTDLYKAFQGFYGGGFSRMNRANLRTEKRNDGLKVVVMPFLTTIIDYSANI